VSVEIYESAHKHAISDEDIEHAIDHALVVADEEGADKVLYLGPDRAGNMLEIVAVARDDDTEIVIHAMRMRRIYETLLRERGEPDG
jgi:transcriptional/translational regulatory protein YebC/TACO1